MSISGSQLKYEGHVSEAGQTLKNIYYYYQYDSTAATPAQKIAWVTGALLGTKYELRGYWKKQTQTVTTDYASGGATNPITNTTYFESAFHHQPTNQETINSLEKRLASKNKICNGFSNIRLRYHFRLPGSF